MAFKIRTVHLIASISCWLILAIAIWLENNYSLVPCPLCVLQRIILALIASCYTILVLYNHLFPRIILILSALVGIILSARQVWLQYWPGPREHSCGAGLAQLMHKYPFLKAAANARKLIIRYGVYH
jgi:disulfide bond formation protein DsbB